MDKQKSEVAQLLQRISLEYEAATRGLTGLSAGSAKTQLYHCEVGTDRSLSRATRGLVGEVQATQFVIEQASEQQEDNTPC